MTTTPAVPPGRPEPLHDIALDVAGLHGSVMALITALVTGGLIGVSTGNILSAFWGLIPGLLAMLATLLGATKTATRGAVVVTPVSDPRDNNNRRLVPETPGTESTVVVDPFTGGGPDSRLGDRWES